MREGITKSGFKFNINENIFKDWDFITLADTLKHGEGTMKEVNKILNGDVPEPFEPYKIRVTLVIRSGPGAEYDMVGYIPVGVYTIVGECNGWGKLKSGIGWIPLDSVERIS